MATAPAAPPPAAAPSSPQPQVTPMATAAPTNPESKKEIHVVPQPVETAPPPKPGSAKEKMFDSLRKRARGEDGQVPREDQTPAAPAKTASASDPNKPDPAADPNVQPAAPGATPPAGGDKKESPWKLVDRYKAKTAELEKQLSEKSALPEQEKKGYLDRLKAAEDRNKELENEVRFANYKKSKEFKDKYEVPYQKAWSTAMSELGELVVTDSSGNSRPMKFDDILQLVNLPLPAAKELAKQMFGEFEGDVMAHRKQIRQLWDAQATALDDALKNGEAMEKERAEKHAHETQTVQKFVSDTWAAANDAVLKDETYGKYFSPVEGDKEGNDRLAKGFAFVDQAFKESPMAPGLTDEQRAAIVKRHSAVRNRAASWGRLRYQNEKLSSRVAELEKQLSEIKGSVPSTGGDSPPSNGTQPTSAREAFRQGLQKYAKTT